MLFKVNVVLFTFDTLVGGNISLWMFVKILEVGRRPFRKPMEENPVYSSNSQFVSDSPGILPQNDTENT